MAYNRPRSQAGQRAPGAKSSWAELAPRRRDSPPRLNDHDPGGGFDRLMRVSSNVRCNHTRRWLDVDGPVEMGISQTTRVGSS
jgi:hypothetical protein